MSRSRLHAAAERFSAHPAIYDLLQRIFGQRQNAKRVARELAKHDGQTILDVGAGTDLYREAIPHSAR